MKKWLTIITICTVFTTQAAEWNQKLSDKLGVDIHGFLDYRYGMRTSSDDQQPQTILNEPRLQLELSYSGDLILANLKIDLLHDQVAKNREVRLEDGKGFCDLREANISLSPLPFMDLKIGRQTLTWGTGDLLFLNDLFPKDWQSFFTGRDSEYLKAPSDAIFISFFPEWGNIDIAYMPRFEADRYVNGEKLSFWNPLTNSKQGHNTIVNPDTPDRYFSSDEWSFRYSHFIKSFETAIYLYDGYWKSPRGFDPISGENIFPQLSVYGASIRGPLGKGIINLETAYYDSREDRSGNNPFIPNCELRFLIGYEQEIAQELTIGAQYYLESMQKYNQYKQLIPKGSRTPQHNHNFTLRLTKMLMNQNLVISIFSRYSANENDLYLRPTITYKYNDQWKIALGGNFFAGKNRNSFLGQFEDNSNLYFSLTYSF